MNKRLCLEEVISDKGLVIGHDTGNSILLDRYAGWRPWWMWASPRSTTSSLVENKRHKINRQTTSHNQTLLRQQHHYHHHSRAGTKRGGFFLSLCFAFATRMPWCQTCIKTKLCWRTVRGITSPARLPTRVKGRREVIALHGGSRRWVSKRREQQSSTVPHLLFSAKAGSVYFPFAVDFIF